MNHSISKKFSSHFKNHLRKIFPKRIEEFKALKEAVTGKQICTVNADQILEGMKGVTGLFYEGSMVDGKLGVSFHGYPITELVNSLPKSMEEDSEEPLPEGILYLLLTGELPQQHDVELLSEELRELGKIDHNFRKFILSLPTSMHSMTMFSICILYLQEKSKFFNAYYDVKNESEHWEHAYDDAMTIIAKVPAIAAAIYRHKYKGDQIIESNPNLDWAGNYAHMLGYDSFGSRECLRGYLTIHCDHDGGNVSAHATQLVGSVLSDPYLAFSAGLNGLAGPLHGLENQESLKFLIGMKGKLGENYTAHQIKDYVKDYLKKEDKIPGYGHAVLRDTDPRFLLQKNFAMRNIKGDPLVDLMLECSYVIPEVLRDHGNKSAHPTIDANSGILLYHYGITQYHYYTVLFGVSRAIGCMANLILARAYGLPMERPDSVNLSWIRNITGVK